MRKKSKVTMARQIAQAAIAFQQQGTGHTPESVTVVQSDGTLVITLHGALSLGEQVLAKSPEGAARVQEFHRQLFNNSANALRQEIKRITGVEVSVFTSGTVVQVFLLADTVPVDAWSGSRPGN
jgi:uncharacterized protein YbcI